MADIKNNIDEVVTDLKNKIDELNNIGSDADIKDLARINEIKQKAIAVLFQVSNKIIDASKNIADEVELEKCIEIVKVRSKELYDNALVKIDEIINSPKIEEIKEEINNAADDINAFFENEEIKNAANNVKETTLDITEKAVKTLKDWLKPEGK